MEITKVWQRDTKWANSIGNTGADRLASFMVGHKPSISKEKKKRKGKQYLKSAIKWSIIKQGMTVYKNLQNKLRYFFFSPEK